MDQNEHVFLERALELARQGVEENKGGPFGCVITLEEAILAEACNMVTSTNDPTAHAEIVAIRKACEVIGSYELKGCTLYTSCEPCTMCFGAIYWARPARVIYAASREDAAGAGFDDDFIYQELNVDLLNRKIKFEQQAIRDSTSPFDLWINKVNRIGY